MNSYRYVGAGLLFVLAGCGGGGGSTPSGGGGSAPGGPSGDQTLSIGSFTTRVSGTTQQPISVAAGNATVVGVAGGTVSSLVLNNPPASASNSQQILAQTKLAFVRNGFLHTMNPDGSGAIQMSFASGGNVTGRPAWSPDGTHIAFCQYDPASSHNQIFLMGATGTAVTRLSDGSTNDEMPSWCAGNNRIAFQRYDAALGKFQIFSMAANGSGVLRISDSSSDDYAPSWSPTGDRVAFTRTSTAGYTHVFVMNSNGSGATDIGLAYSAYGMFYPAWSPDGSKIAFTLSASSGSTISLVRPDGTGAQNVTTGASPSDNYPCWSPNGTKLAFVRYDNATTRDQIWTCDEDGLQQVQADDGTANDLAPAWSPYVANRRLIGTGGFLLSGAGFLAGEQGTNVNSVVVFNATTPDTAFISTPAQLVAGQPSLAMTVTADSLTGMLYSNNFTALTGVLGGTTTATGATVTFSSNDGTVSSVLPFKSTKAAARPGERSDERHGDEFVFHRQFLGVWDAKGKNLAPGGASEVHVDARSGALVSFH